MMDIRLRVNGQDHLIQIEPHETLGRVLNERLRFTGVRLSCEEGECGSCTVLVDGEAITACLLLAAHATESEILTVEGIGTADNLHPIQQAFVDEHGFQCSFCTPGLVMSTLALLDAGPVPPPEKVAEALSGHICRCGSYANIIRSVTRAAESYPNPQATEQASD